LKGLNRQKARSRRRDTVLRKAVIESLAATATLNEPWGVVPDSTSTILIEQITHGDSIYDNTLSGDGAISMLADSSGIQLGGVNISIVGNDISNLPAGINLYSGVNYFDLVDQNSIHNVAHGIQTYIAAPFGQNPVPWVLGNSFRGNSVSSTDGELFENNDNFTSVGFSVSGDSQASGAATDTGLILMNVFDQNLVSGFDVATAFLLNAASTTGYAGIVDTVFANNCFLSNGQLNSAEVLKLFGDNGSVDIDSVPDVLMGQSNLWQAFAYSFFN